MEFFLNNNYFNVGEKIILNSLAEGNDKEYCCEQLLFGKNVTIDEECSALFQTAYDKICNFSDDDWNNLQKYLPFNVPVHDEDFLYEEADESR